MLNTGPWIIIITYPKRISAQFFLFRKSVAPIQSHELYIFAHQSKFINTNKPGLAELESCLESLNFMD